VRKIEPSIFDDFDLDCTARNATFDVDLGGREESVQGDGKMWFLDLTIPAMVRIPCVNESNRMPKPSDLYRLQIEGSSAHQKSSRKVFQCIERLQALSECCGGKKVTAATLRKQLMQS